MVWSREDHVASIFLPLETEKDTHLLRKIATVFRIVLLIVIDGGESLWVHGREKKYSLVFSRKSIQRNVNPLEYSTF